MATSLQRLNLTCKNTCYLRHTDKEQRQPKTSIKHLCFPFLPPNECSICNRKSQLSAKLLMQIRSAIAVRTSVLISFCATCQNYSSLGGCVQPSQPHMPRGHVPSVTSSSCTYACRSRDCYTIMETYFRLLTNLWVVFWKSNPSSAQNFVFVESFISNKFLHHNLLCKKCVLIFGLFYFCLVGRISPLRLILINNPLFSEITPFSATITLKCDTSINRGQLEGDNRYSADNERYIRTYMESAVQITSRDQLFKE